MASLTPVNVIDDAASLSSAKSTDTLDTDSQRLNSDSLAAFTSQFHQAGKASSLVVGGDWMVNYINSIVDDHVRSKNQKSSASSWWWSEGAEL